MTGIERLRQMAEDFKNVKTAEHCTFIVNTWRGRYIDDAIADIADQIERETKTSSEVEKMKCAPDDVSMSAYDLLPEEDREAIAWVREHGGLGHVMAEWRSRSNLKRMYEKERSKVERQQRHIEFVQGKCRERQGHIVELSKELAELRKVLSDYRDALGGMCERLGITDGTSLPEMPDVICEALDRRLMPEGYEWPRYEGGPLLRYGDSYIGNDGDNHRAWQIRFDSNADVHVSRGGDGDGFDRTTWDHFNKGERVKRPAPKVLDADGVETRLNDKVYDQDGTEWYVNCIPEPGDPSKIQLRLSVKPQGSRFVAVDPQTITNRAPVIAADGRPLRKGEHVWHVETGAELVVRELPKPGEYQAVVVFAPPASHLTSFDPDRLTHERPDSWERLEEDADATAHLFDAFDEDASARIRDIVRRAKALAERDAS